MVSNKAIFLLGYVFILFILWYYIIQIQRLDTDNQMLRMELSELQRQQSKGERIKTPIIGGGAGGGKAIEVPTIDLNRRDDLVVIYNRVPKTGSTSFVNVAYDLCRQNSFHVLHLNVTDNMHVLSLPNQAKFVHNVTNWEAIKPALYHGHMAFINFQKFGVSFRPVWINLIRRPLDRLVSYYYFLRYGDDFRPYLVRRKHGDKMTFDECVLRKQPDCHPDNMWLQIPFFCGHSTACWKRGNSWALQEAKRNLISQYLLVGVTEEMVDFIKVLETTLPSLFRGATNHFLNSEKSHLRRTVQKLEPSSETISKIQESKVWQMEQELYGFALAHFHFVRKQIFENNATLQAAVEKSQIFMYEKIRPK